MAESGKRAEQLQAEAQQAAKRRAESEKQWAADKTASAAKIRDLEKQLAELAKTTAAVQQESARLQGRLAEKERELERAAEKDRQLQAALAAVNAAFNDAGGAK